MRRCWRIAAVALAAGGFAGAHAEVQVACPADAQALPLVALFGTWEMQVQGQPGTARVRLSQHPDYAGVRGRIERDGAAAEVAGDIDDEGLLSIDESLDGRSISATWSGTLQPGACGKVFEGTWRRAGETEAARFVLRKAAPADGPRADDNNINRSRSQP